jgi:NAD dependent epimerase/dehydratase
LWLTLVLLGIFFFGKHLKLLANTRFFKQATHLSPTEKVYIMEQTNHKVLVTGAAGFIGSHLVEGLVEAGHQVRAMVHYNFQNSWGWLDTFPKALMAHIEVVAGDIRDPFFVRTAVSGCDTVYHLAALIAIPYSYIAPATYLETNIQGSLNILQACRDAGVSRLVHTSTSEVYGTAQYVPIDEKHPLVGQSPYSASKIGADKLAESYFLSFGTPVATIRPFNTFGPRQSARAVIPTLITQALSGAKVISLGSMDPVRDFNYVKDTVRGFMAVAACDQAVGRVTNIGRGQGISIAALAELILKLCQSSATLQVDSARIRPETSEVFELVCDSSQALRLLNWQPDYSVEEGLEATVAWLRENLFRYKSDHYNV